jgi:hypothetical protein
VVDYRVYKLNAAGRITDGEWINAEADDAAITLARQMCDHETPFVEIWQRQRKVALVECGGARDPP